MKRPQSPIEALLQERRQVLAENNSSTGSRFVQANDWKNDCNGFPLDNVRAARQESRVLRSSVLPATEQVPRDSRFSSLLVTDSEAVARHTRSHWILSPRQTLEPQFLDSLCLGRRKGSDGFRRENSA